MKCLPWFARFSLTAGGLGQLPASGTWGSLPPALLLIGLHLMGTSTFVREGALILLGLWGCIACVRFGDAAEIEFGKKDPGRVVADEVAGMSFMLLWLPTIQLPGQSSALPLAASVAIAFLLFRALDIAKLPPARSMQAIRGGWGILIDDLIAAAQGWVVLQVGARLILPTLAAA